VYIYAIRKIKIATNPLTPRAGHLEHGQMWVEIA